MDFLSSIYLWFLPLSTLPLLIHLFYNRKFKTVNFSSIRFLKILKIDTIRKVRIIEILLLIIRTLILLSIILMLSKPVIKSESIASLTLDDPILCVIGLDDSFSMTKSKKTTSIRDFHSQNINKIINTLPVNSIVNIVSLTDTATLYKGLVENYSEEKILSKMKNTYSNYSLLSAYLNKSNEQLNKEVHIFSDLQKSSFHKNQENQLKDWNVFVHDISGYEDNISIISSKIINEMPTINKEIEIEVSVQNDSSNNAKNALLILNIDNINIAQHQFDLNPLEIKTLRFKTILTSPGEHHCSFELIYDNMLGDNFYYFPITINSDIDIGILSNSDKDYYFIQNSLKALSSTHEGLNYRFINTLMADHNKIVENDVNFIFGYDFISNNNIEDAIIDNFNNGGHNYIFPSENENPDNENNDFFDFLSYDRDLITLMEYDSTFYYDIYKKNIFNTAISNLFESKEDEELFKVFKHFEFSDYKNPVMLVNGKSIWEKIENGKGAINLLGFNFDLDWTNLPIKASYLSFIDFLINIETQDEMKLYESGDSFNKGDSYKIIKTPDNKNYILNKDSPPFVFKTPGIYTINQNNNYFDLYVNPPYLEVLYEKIDFKFLSDYYENIYLVENDSNLEEFITVSRVGVELWKYFLYIAIILIIIEMVISNQFFRRI